jgi:hypothetical protein
MGILPIPIKMVKISIIKLMPIPIQIMCRIIEIHMISLTSFKGKLISV